MAADFLQLNADKTELLIGASAPSPHLLNPRSEKQLPHLTKCLICSRFFFPSEEYC